MVSIDIIIISFAKNEDFKKLTTSAISSLFNSESTIDFNVYLIESNKLEKYEEYLNNPKVHVIYPNVPFGYHRYLNIGIKAGSGQYTCLCNNDLLFSKGWATALLTAMEKNPKLVSTSPYSTNPHKTVFKLDTSTGIDYGYLIRRHVSGWCIFQKREIFKTIGYLDERFEFWYADNDYAETLKKHNMLHGLVRNSIVEHIESKTLTSNTSAEQHRLTRAQLKVFENKWKK